MKIFYIYKITNLINNKVYIGQSVSPISRWRRHKSDAKLHKNKSHLTSAINKYGIENFFFEILLEKESLEEIDVAEIYTIKQYKSSNKEYGYNIAHGGNGKRIVSDQTKKRISEFRKGKKATEETKNKMSNSMLGKNKGSHNGMFGKKSQHAKLTQFQANEIRKEYFDNHISCTKLANIYNVSKKTILNIIHNRIYKI